ncbi:MAG: YicC/YloC family endoribonuclease [Candidatus Babeliales bacterium]
MIRSMTGFVAGSISIVLDPHQKATITITIKSLNSRFFDFSCKLNHHFAQLEIDLAQLLKKKLLRGCVQLAINIDNPQFFQQSITPSLSAINEYLTALDIIKKEYSVPGTITINDLMKLPHTFIYNDQPLNHNFHELIKDKVNHLADKLIQEQHAEGIILKKDLEDRLAIMAKEIEIIKLNSQHLIDKQKDKISTIITQHEGDETKILELKTHTAYVLLDKMDIHEEIVRFKNHLNNSLTTLNDADKEKGKRLDFILQELSREINTIAAKCADVTTSDHAINIKVEVEKVREQIHNII